MIQFQVETHQLAQCPEGHNSYFPFPKGKYCSRCGGPVELRDVKVTVNRCDECGNEVEAFMPPFPVRFCPYCGRRSGWDE